MPITYTNRKGVTYYLCQSVTKMMMGRPSHDCLALTRAGSGSILCDSCLVPSVPSCPPTSCAK